MTNAGMNPVLAEFTNPGSYIGLHGFNKFGPKLKPVEDLAARGTQIKNYYGLNEGNQDITPAMWEYARRNYVKDTGINNNMTEWLNSVDERDIIAFTKWLSKHSPAIAAPLIGGTLYDDK